MFKRQCQVRFPISDTDTTAISLALFLTSCSNSEQVFERFLTLGSVWFKPDHFFLEYWKIFHIHAVFKAFHFVAALKEVMLQGSGVAQRKSVGTIFGFES